jgi:hypothetical protein
VANHVIYDRIWESKKLAACSLRAALAYPWIYLVADDWGRFEYVPKRIWGRVFGSREDVRLAEVVAWLAEYERVGLLVRYEVGGHLLCQWTRFVGPPPAKRHAPTMPGPSGVIETTGFKAKSRFQSGSVMEDRWKPDGSRAASPEWEPEPEQEPEAGTGTGTECAPDVDAARTAEEDARKAAQGTLCPDCRFQLKRQKGQYTNGVGQGVGWYCQAKVGGCGREFRRDDPRIWPQLPTRVQQSILAQIEAERQHIEDQERARETPGVRAVRELVAQATPANGAWDHALKRLKDEIHQHSFATWLRPTTCQGLIGDRLLIRVPSATFLTWIRDNYAAAIAAAVAPDLRVTLLTEDMVVDLDRPPPKDS